MILMMIMMVSIMKMVLMMMIVVGMKMVMMVVLVVRYKVINDSRGSYGCCDDGGCQNGVNRL